MCWAKSHYQPIPSLDAIWRGFIPRLVFFLLFKTGMSSLIYDIIREIQFVNLSSHVWGLFSTPLSDVMIAPKQRMFFFFTEWLFIAAHGREDNISSTYDTLVPDQVHGLQQLIELQRRVKAGSLTVDGALERFSDWQRVQKGMDAVQQVGLSHNVITLTLDLE